MAAEATFALLRHGYRLGADLADTAPATRAVRVLGQPALMVAGEEAVRLFYDEDLLVRSGAVPAPLSDELFGLGTVHGLDGTDHAHRKTFHLRTLGADDVSDILVALERAWAAVTSGEPPPRPGKDLFDTLIEALGTAALEWSGVGAVDAGRRSRDLMLIVDGFGSVGARHLRGRRARRRCEAWVGVEPGSYEFVPQGGGPREGRRCPGEPAVVEVLRYLVARLAEDVEVSPTFDSTRMPTVPRRRLTRST